MIVEDEKLLCILHAGIERMGVQPAKARGEIAMLHRRQMLILEEDHQMFQQRLADVRHLGVVQPARKVHILDNGPDRRGQHLNVHGGLR